MLLLYHNLSAQNYFPNSLFIMWKSKSTPTKHSLSQVSTLLERGKELQFSVFALVAFGVALAFLRGPETNS